MTGGRNAMFALLFAAARLDAGTHIVCPAESQAAQCRYHGGRGIQAAVDAAASGDTILLKPGRYTASAFRDVPYKIHTLRGFIVIEGKDLTLAAEPGAVLDGTSGAPTTALVVHRAAVHVRGLTITGFRYDEQEDEIYEGHGIFVIDGAARIEDVTLSKFQKMGLTGRGDTRLEARRLRILDGHVAIWLEESTYLRLEDALVRGNDSSGIAAYGRAVAHVSNSVFDGNLDDGLYTEDNAALYLSNSLLLRNRPNAAYATGDSTIWLGHSGLFENANATGSKERARVLRGPGVIETDPKIDAAYRLLPGSPLAREADPDLRDRSGRAMPVGLRQVSAPSR